MRLFFSCLILLLFGGCAPKKNVLTLDELLAKESGQYMQVYKHGIDMYKDSSYALEPLIEMTSNETKDLPGAYRLNRYDLAVVRPGNKLAPVEFNIAKDSILKFEEATYYIKGMEVNIKPFVWNGCEFSFNGMFTYFDIYNEWTDKWLDLKDRKKANADGYLNVIHSITPGYQSKGKFTVAIDFGSAPPVAFKELLYILAELNCPEVNIHSRSFK